MNRFFVLALRVLLVILFIGVTGAQAWFVPQVARDSAAMFSELAYLAVPYAALWVGVGLCAQTVFVAVWMLLSKIRRGVIFSDTAFVWVNAIIGAGVIATSLVFAFGFYHAAIVGLGPPFLVIVLAGLGTLGIAFVLVMLVMRGLLRSAAALQGELEAVV